MSAILKGQPVFICRRGVYPNKSEVMQIVANWSRTHLVRTERMINRFAITVAPLKTRRDPTDAEFIAAHPPHPEH